MERLAFIGFENKSAITEKYAGAAQLCFDPPCENAAQCFEFSAAFIKSGAPCGVLQSWLLNEHPRLAADENAVVGREHQLAFPQSHGAAGLRPEYNVLIL